MHVFALEAPNNGDFVFIRNVHHWAEMYDLANCVLRSQLRRPGAGQDAAFEFSTLNGRVLYLPEPRQIIMSARAGELGHLKGTFDFDLRVEIEDAIRHPIYGGAITFLQGATR